MRDEDEIIDWIGQLIMIGIVILWCVFLSSCLTVKHWGVDEHSDMMLQCRAICGKDNVQSYEPLTGTCECKEQKNVH